MESHSLFRDTRYSAGRQSASVNLPRTAARFPQVGDAGLLFELRTNLFLGTREMGEKILQYLIQAGDVFVPEVFDGGKITRGRKMRFDPNELTLPLKTWVDGRYSLGIIAERHNPVESYVHVSATDFLMFDHLSISIDSKWFVDRERIDRLLAVAKDLYAITQANSGYIQNWRHERAIGESTDEHGNLTGYIPRGAQWSLRGLFWANFFGPEYVDLFGKAKLMAAPCYGVEGLSDGGVLLLLSESPFDASTKEYQTRKQGLYAYLGDDAFRGKLLPNFRTEGRKKRDARPLVETGGIRDDIFH